MTNVWPIQMLRALFAALMIAVIPVSVSAQEAVTEIDQAQYELERKIQAGIEQLRQLHSEGRYEEVISNANYILSLDPHNRAARVWKDRAQEKLQKVGSTFPEPNTGRELIDPQVVPEPTPVADQLPIDQIQITPVPLAPRKKSSGISEKIPPYVLIALVVVAVVFIGIAIFAWLRVRSSQRQLSDAIAEAERKRAAQRDDPSFSDRPTSVHDAVTQVHGGDPVRSQPAKDDDSVMQYGEVGVSDETGDDYMNSFKTRSVADAPTTAEAASASSAPTEFADEDTFVGRDMQGDEEAPLSFDTSNMFAMPSAPEPVRPVEQRSEPADDPNEMSFNSMMFANNEETVMPPAAAPKKPAQPAGDADDALSFNSLMFSGAAETRSPGQKNPADTSLQNEDPDAMTFNSLMFSGADETRLPGASREDTSLPSNAPEEGEMTFNSMMFGSGEETVAPGMGGGANAKGAGGDNLGETMMMTGGDGEETINISGLSMEGDSVGDKFEEQKSQGLKAMSRGDFKSAVQALSVAAGLRPDDREVANSLAEARRRRDG